MSKSPKAILRLSRRAARSTGVSTWLPLAEPYHVWRRSLHLVALPNQPSVASGPQPPWLDASWYSPQPGGSGSYQSSASSSSSQHAKSGNSSQYYHHALLPYSDLNGPLPGSEAYALSALQSPSSFHASLPLAYLPIYQAPQLFTSSSNSGPSEAEPQKERRSDTTPQLCFGQSGAAGIPKSSQTLIPSIVGASGTSNSFTAEHSVQVGEDAYFVSPRGSAMGVADGVGGWARYTGSDSAQFSRLLMHRKTSSELNLSPLLDGLD